MGHVPDRRRNKRISKRQENQAAADLGGRTQANSGATRLGGGADVRELGNTRVECKFTSKSVYVLTYDDLEKLRVQAVKNLEEPVFQIAFQDRLGRFDKYAIVPLLSLHADLTAFKDFERLAVEGKSIRIHQSYLQANLGGARHLISFGRRPRQFEILTWDKFLERRATDA